MLQARSWHLRARIIDADKPHPSPQTRLSAVFLIPPPPNSRSWSGVNIWHSTRYRTRNCGAPSTRVRRTKNSDTISRSKPRLATVLCIARWRWRSAHIMAESAAICAGDDHLKQASAESARGHVHQECSGRHKTADAGGLFLALLRHPPMSALRPAFGDIKPTSSNDRL